MSLANAAYIPVGMLRVVTGITMPGTVGTMDIAGMVGMAGMAGTAGGTGGIGGTIWLRVA